MNQLYKFVFCFFIAGLQMLPTTVMSQEANTVRDGFSKMSLEIQLRKPEFHLYESIEVDCKFANGTKEPISTITPDFLSESGIEIVSGDETRTFGSVSELRVYLRRFASEFKPGASIESRISLGWFLDDFFPKPGTYKFRLLVSMGEFGTIRSNFVELSIEEPKGINAEAVRFIQENNIHRVHHILLNWDENYRNENGESLLEEFVRRFSGSSYGDQAILELGSRYSLRGELEKARIEFHKLKTSKNPQIAAEALRRLGEIGDPKSVVTTQPPVVTTTPKAEPKQKRPVRKSKRHTSRRTVRSN